MKKKLILFLALLFLVINTVPAFAYVWALSLLRFGANSAWIAGGSRTISALVKATPKGVASGVIPAAKTAWVALTKNKATLAQFAVGTVGSAGLAAAGSAIYNNWDSWATEIGASLGWVKVGDTWMKYTGTSAYSLSDMRAVNYFFNTTLPGMNNHQSPNTNINQGIYENLAAAQAAATAKRNELLNNSAYQQISPITFGIYNQVGVDTYDNAAKFRAEQVGAKVVATGTYEWFYYLSPYAGGATLVQPSPTTETLSDDAKNTALGDSLANNNAKAKAVVEAAEKAANDAIANGKAATTPGWCGAGKTYQECLDEWAKDGETGLEDEVVQDGDDVPADDPVDPDAESITVMRGKVNTRVADFINTIKASSLGGLYNNMFGSIPTSSQCEMQVALGETFGGTQTVSFCGWSAWLSVLASVLLIVAGYIAIKIIFKGG